MHRLGCSRVFALCFTLSCSLRLSVWLSINACRQLLLRSPRYVKRPDGCGRQRPSWISDCAGFSPLAATNGFRLRFRPRDDSRPLVHAREPRAQQEIDRARQEMKRKSTRKSPGPTHLRDKRSSRSNIEDFRLSSLQRRGVFGLYQ